MPARSYDSKCHALADSFLSDEAEINTEANCDELAAIIQSAIEDHIAGLRRERSLNEMAGA